MRLQRAFVFLLLATAIALPVAAQVTTADLVGRVLDPKGLAVPGAKVTVLNSDTGFKRETLTVDSGDFAVTLLPAGTYKVMIEKEGFATAVYEKLELAVGSKQPLEVNLKLGSSRETVTVSEEPPLIENTRSDLSGTVSPAEVKNLPILDRNFSGLMTLIPGVRPAQGFDPTKTRSGNISLNGSDGRSFDYNVDGADNKDNVIGGIVQNFTMEGIQEFNVVTDRYTAESGRTAAGVVNVVSKSGSNRLHGTAFGLFQNSGLNKNDFFTLQGCAGASPPIAADNCPKPKFHRYQFGGSAGGALIKDKLFIFGAYEHKREPGNITVNPNSFSELSLFPLASPVSQLPFPYTDHLLTVKMDWHLSDHQNMFFRYGRERWINPNDQLGNPFTADLSQANSDTNQFHDFVVAHNYNIGSNKVNSFSVHFQDFVNAILAAPGRNFTVPVAGGGSATNPEICFKPTPGCGGGDPEIGQNVNVPQETLIRKYQFRDDFSWTVNRHNMKFGANWIYLAKIGGFFFFGANGYQIIFWDDPSKILGNTTTYPQGFATPGAVQEILFSGGSGSTGQEPPHALAFYYQDDFKVTPRLTVNLGLRWDANPKFLPQQLGDSATSSNRTINVLRQIVAANPSLAAAQDGLARAKAIAGNNDDLSRRTASWKEFQPRIGFAWDPVGSGKLVVRGGYGISRDQVFQNLTLFALQQAQPTIYQTIIDVANSGRPGVCTPTSTLTPQQDLCKFRFGVDGLPAPAPGITDIAVGAFGRINDPHFNDPWSQQWSIGAAWQFHPDFAFTADYYHVLGTHEPRVLNINPRLASVCNGSNPADPRCVRGTSTRFFDAAFQAVPGLGAGRLEQINMIGTNSRSRFDSINFQIKKRFSHRFTGQASYVVSWSNSWGGRPTASYGGNGIAITPENEFLGGEYGPTIFDERHRFVGSGIFQLPLGFELAPIFQAASARPFTFRAGADIDGDGRTTLDRVCVGSTLASPVITLGCKQVPVNSLRGDPFIQMDLRAAKVFKFGERANLRVLWEFYNLFNRDNFCNNFQQNAQSSSFNKPQGYCGGQGFGPAFSGPLRSQFGFRFEF